VEWVREGMTWLALLTHLQAISAAPRAFA
jgi:hypothetical protein